MTAPGKIAFIVVVTLLLSGCLSIPAFDQVTTDQIELTIEFENLAFSFIEEPTADDQAIHDSEITRLQAWLAYEGSKKLTGEAQ